MSYLRIYSVDSFSSVPFSGNPAAVCLDDTKEGLSENMMQKIAAEMNLSETAFIKKAKQNGKFEQDFQFHLRWFTPTNEVNLCGHATLATAAVIFKTLENANEELHFETKSGLLKAKKAGEKILLDFPANPAANIERKDVEDLIKVACVDKMVSDILFSPGTKKLLLRLQDSYTREDIKGHRPKIDQFMKVNNPAKVTGIILTLKGSTDNGCVDTDGKPYDFVSRYFAPWNGIDEDPVTGAAHTVLTPYWAKELGKKQLYANQCSARGGELWLNLREDGRLDMAGHSTVVLQGTISY